MYNLRLCFDIYILFPLQTFKVFEKLADQDRQRLLTELQRREESQQVPPAVQELEITAEPPEVTVEQSTEVTQEESLSKAAVDVSAKVTVGPPAESSHSSSHAPGQSSSGEEAAAVSTDSAE